MHTANTNAVPDNRKLRPLNDVIPEVVQDEKNPATYWRWFTRGIADADGNRICLQVWYVGREPRTTIEAVRQFIEAVTAARLARMARTQERAVDVTNEELAAVGLSGPRP